MAAIRDTFFQECEEQLAELEAGLIRMSQDSVDTDTVNAVFRAVHSIKGGAGIFGLDDLVRFAHVFETTLDALRSGRLESTPPVMKLLLQAADVLADLIAAARQGGTVDATHIQAVIDEFGKVNKPKTEVAAPALATAPPAPLPPAWRIGFKPLGSLYAKGNEALLLLRELSALPGARIVIDTGDLPTLIDLDPEGAYLNWIVNLDAGCDEAAIREIFDFVEDDCILELARNEPEPDVKVDMDFEFFGTQGEDFEFFGPTPEALDEKKPATDVASSPVHAPSPVEAMAAKAESGASVSSTIRVDLDRVDRLIDLVGELVINEAMLSQRVLEAGIARGSGVSMALDELEHLTREIQDSVMAIRAQPVRSVFQRMPRLVRELAAQTGKQVRLVMEGEGTEVDKTVIERITDPLTHMIRNAIDHGLEPTEDRIARGKPAEGIVKLNALHRSGRIVLEVSDDGGGIDRPRVKAKAIEKGLIEPDAQLSDDDIDNLIFLPGFSTASSISNISGRGVGMDVVRQSVQALGGRISIVSRPGKGSVFTLSLPLTLAVLDGMVVRAGVHTLIVPLGAIIETLKPKAEHVHALDNDLKVISLRGGYIPIICVANTLGFDDDIVEAENSVALLVEAEGGARAVLLVQAIDGQRQVVIKSLEANYRAVPGIAAATVMGNGRVALILDIDAIVSSARMDAARTGKLRSDQPFVEAR